MEKSKMGLESEKCLQEAVRDALAFNKIYLKLKERKLVMNEDFKQKITVEYRDDRLEIETDLGNAQDVVTAFMTIMTFLGFTANTIDDTFNEDYSMLCKGDTDG